MKENLQKKRKLQDPGKCECKMMAQTENLIVKMNRQYKDFSKGQKKLADYICKNYDKAVFLTAARLGAEVGVSESTTVRFATQLGYQDIRSFSGPWKNWSEIN